MDGQNSNPVKELTDERRLWNQRTASLIPYVPGEQPRERLIKLNTNESPFAPPDCVMDVVKKQGAEPLRLYPDPECRELRKAIGEYYGLSADHIFVGNGSDEVLAMAFQAFFEPVKAARADRRTRQTILFPDITYSFYPVYARFNNLDWQTVAVNEQFEVPIEDFLHPSGGVVLANPNAPTGIALPIEAIEQIVQADRDRLVLIDEAYVDFGAVSSVSLIHQYDNILVVQTCSKSRALAGARIGYALGAPGLIKALEAIRDSFNSYTVNRLTQQIGIAAFAATDWYEKTRAQIICNRSRQAEILLDRGFQILPSAANFLFVRHVDFSGEFLYRTLKEMGILVRHFNIPRIDQYLRITVGSDEQILALARALDQLLI